MPLGAVVHEVAGVRHERVEAERVAATQLGAKALDRARAQLRIGGGEVDQVTVVRADPARSRCRERRRGRPRPRPSSTSRSAHWLACLVKICAALAPISRTRSAASRGAAGDRHVRAERRAIAAPARWRSDAAHRARGRSTARASSCARGLLRGGCFACLSPVFVALFDGVFARTCGRGVMGVGRAATRADRRRDRAGASRSAGEEGGRDRPRPRCRSPGPCVTVVPLRDADAGERAVHGVVAAAVLDDHREAVGADRLGDHHLARRDRLARSCRPRAAMPSPFQRVVVLFGFTTRPKR